MPTSMPILAASTLARSHPMWKNGALNPTPPCKPPPKHLIDGYSPYYFSAKPSALHFATAKPARPSALHFATAKPPPPLIPYSIPVYLAKATEGINIDRSTSVYLAKATEDKIIDRSTRSNSLKAEIAPLPMACPPKPAFIRPRSCCSKTSKPTSPPNVSRSPAKHVAGIMI